MGEMIEVSCAKCGTSLQESVGVGMMGRGTALVVCEHCRRFIRKQLESFPEHPVPPYKCPYCHNRTVEVTSFGPTASCPDCGSPLLVEMVGLWD